MLTRITSVLLSLLVHGTVLLYPGSPAQEDRPVPAATDKSLRLAFVRGENPPRETASKATRQEPEPARQPGLAKTPAESAPAPVDPVSAPDRPGVVRKGVTRQETVTPDRPRKSPPAPAPIKRQARAVRPVESPARPRPLKRPPTRDTSEQRVAAAIAAADPSKQLHSPEPVQRSAAALLEIEATYKRDLLAAIERHKRYPLRARKKGYQGEVLVLFTVLRNGTISGIEIAGASRWAVLDRAAAGAVRKLGRFKPIPPRLGRDHWRFQVPIRFAMN